MSDRVRIGDRERANAAERLSAHHAAGRLTLDELETRVAPLVAAGVALAVVATVAIGHPVFPPVLLALSLWCAAARRHPTRRSHA